MDTKSINSLIHIFTNLAANHKDNPAAIERLCETLQWSDKNGDNLCEGACCGSSCPFYGKISAELIVKDLKELKDLVEGEIL